MDWGGPSFTNSRKIQNEPIPRLVRLLGRLGFKFGMNVITDALSDSKLKADHISQGDDQYRFHTTRWSMVLLSAQSQVPGFQAALGEL